MNGANGPHKSPNTHSSSSHQTTLSMSIFTARIQLQTFAADCSGNEYVHWEHREWFTLPHHTIPYHTTIPYFAFASGSIQFLNSMLNISIFSLWLLLLLHGQTAIWAKLFHSEQALSLQHSTRQRNRFQSLMQLSSFTLYRCNQKFFPAAYSRLA